MKSSNRQRALLSQAATMAFGLALLMLAANDAAAQATNVLQSTGNAGIGTTSPGSILTVQTTGPDSTGEKYLRVKNTSSFTGLLLDPGQAGDAGWLLMGGYPNAGDFTVREHNVGDYLTIKKTTGYVGFGTATPSEPFTLLKAGTTMARIGDSDTGNSMVFGVSAVYGPLMQAHTDSAGNALMNVAAMRAEFGGWGFIVRSSPATAVGSPRTFTERFRITSGGYVGIGAAAPQGKFHIYDATAGSELIGRIQHADNSSASSNSIWRVISGNLGTSKLEFSSSSFWKAAIWSGANKDLQFYTGGQPSAATERMRILDNGNIGIGTTNPLSKLDVNGAVNATAFNVSGSPLTSSQWTSGSGNINYTSGNVGIGTASPFLRLQIQSTAGSIVGSQLNNSDFILGTTGSALYSGLGAASGTTYSEIQAFINGDTAPGSLILNRQGGNVGIGTTSPSSSLDIVKNQNANTFVRIANNDSGAGGKAYFLADNGTSTFRLQQNGTGFGGVGATLAGEGVLYNTSPALTVMTDNAAGIIKFATGGSGEKMRLDATGKLGIGKTNPAFLVDVAGAVNATAFNINGSPVTSSQWATSGSTINYGAGNVGIGTSSPTSKLDVTGDINASGTINAVGGLNINGSPVTSSQWATSGSTINYGAGNVGIGTSSPTSKLDVIGNINSSGTINAVGGLNINGSPVTSSQWATSGTNINYAAAGNVGIGIPTGSSPAEKLHVVGNGKITGSLTVDGTINAKYQDVAEWVPSSEQLSAGTVVILDQSKSNQVISSTVSYDTRVAGVISEQPGITLGESGAGKVLVATTGRVRVKVDATRAPIQIGDLLVTSDVSGVAMKSEPIELGGRKMHMPGTLIGKALEPLAKGKGEILVLLSLQ